MTRAKSAADERRNSTREATKHLRQRPHGGIAKAFTRTLPQTKVTADMDDALRTAADTAGITVSAFIRHALAGALGVPAEPITATEED